MTDNNSDTSSVQSQGSLVRTVRRAEIVEHLTDFRMNVDRAIHALPGVLLGVSCAGVIQASMHLTWHIEHLRGSLIEAMLREGYNPINNSENGNRVNASQPNSTVTTSTRGPDLPRPNGRERSHNQSMGDYMGSVIHSELASHSRGPYQYPQHNRTSTTIPSQGYVVNAGDQVVPEQYHRTTVAGPSYYGSYPTHSSQGNAPVLSTTGSDHVNSDQARSVESNSRYSVEAVQNQGTTGYSAPSGQYQTNQQ